MAKPAGAFAQRQFQMITMLGRSHEWAREASSLCSALHCPVSCPVVAGLSNWQMQMIEEPFNISLRTEIAGDQFPVEKDFKRLVE